MININLINKLRIDAPPQKKFSSPAPKDILILNFFDITIYYSLFYMNEEPTINEYY